jgi:hypothetical protein
VNECLDNNTNYERKFYLDEKLEVEISKGKFDRLKANLDKMNKDINESNEIRDHVIE